jgi:xanthine dehydrogenase accessory factor
MGTVDLYRRMVELTEAGTPFVVATVVEALGSTPRRAGAKMLVLPDGSTVDTVGGGAVERHVIMDALESLKRGASRTVEYELRPKGEHALGMICGGETKVFLEVHLPTKTLVIAGAGHIAQKLAPMAKMLDFRVVVVDSRPEVATADNLPEADEVIVGHPGQLPALVDVGESTYVVIVTHGHVHDKDTLAAVVGSQAAYIGMIGSRNKVRTVLSQLREEGVSEEALARVYAPIGINLGGNRPAEIAVSILAEIIALDNGLADALRGGSPEALRPPTEQEAEAAASARRCGQC